MSYNTRRPGQFGPPISAVGQRRLPPTTNNFVTAGGQMNRQAGGQQNKPQQQAKPLLQQQAQQQQNRNAPQQVQQKQGIQPPVKAAPPIQQVKPPAAAAAAAATTTTTTTEPAKLPVQQAKPTMVPAPPQVQQQPQQQVNMQVAAEQLLTQQQQEEEMQQNSVEQCEFKAANVNVEGEHLPAKPKPFWMKRTGRITKAEKMRKRNLRLRKMLQPKNALMVLNELVGSTSYTVNEVKLSGFDDVFKASVTVEGIEHFGTGKSKVGAKTAAAETAIRYIVLRKVNSLGQFSTTLSNSQNEGTQSDPGEGDGDMKMDTVQEEQSEDQVSWSHIASFAIHKLFSSWDEDGNITDMFSRSNSPGNVSLDSANKRSGSTAVGFPVPEQKPAKKLPENATHMNPIMLLNQMHPNAKYEEVSKVGNPPHIQFTIKCTVLEQSFIGVGPNKKSARKQAAFAACTQVLGIHYPPDALEQNAPASAQQPQAAMEVL